MANIVDTEGLKTGRADLSWMLLLAAWSVSLVAAGGALFIGEVMGQAPCNLCWFQRAFMFPLVVVLGMASYRVDTTVWPYAFALAAAGALLSAYHTLLYVGLISEELAPCSAAASCSGSNMTIMGGLPIPILSLVAFVIIALCLLSIRWRRFS